MLFVSQWSYSPENRDALIARWKKTGGTPPPGVKMLGRWHVASQGGGFLLAETDDAQAIAKWSLEWTDLMSLTFFPVLDDAGITKVLP